jgi:hypothetical protein
MTGLDATAGVAGEGPGCHIDAERFSLVRNPAPPFEGGILFYLDVWKAGFSVCSQALRYCRHEHKQRRDQEDAPKGLEHTFRVLVKGLLDFLLRKVWRA